jgi:signal transduction histidine kinase
MSMTRRRFLASAALAAAMALPRTGLADTFDADQARAGKLELYAFADTRRLVALVEDAAALMEREGEGAFAEFTILGSRWYDGSIYLFAYTLEGTCLFHAVTPALVGHQLIDLRDINGKPVIRMIADVGRKPEPDASGWVFYLWQDGTQLSPSWKSAYVRKVIMPGGRTVIVGSGVYNIKMEKVFIEEKVARAVALLESAGKDTAFQAFTDPAAPFSFLGTFIFVLDGTGRTLVDPAFPNHAGRDLSGFKDAVGFEAIAELIKKLQTADQAWVQFLWPKPGEPLPSRKLLYARKVRLGGETLIVGSDYFLATPIWMRV